MKTRHTRFIAHFSHQHFTLSSTWPLSSTLLHRIISSTLASSLPLVLRYCDLPRFRSFHVLLIRFTDMFIAPLTSCIQYHSSSVIIIFLVSTLLYSSWHLGFASSLTSSSAAPQATRFQTSSNVQPRFAATAFRFYASFRFRHRQRFAPSFRFSSPPILVAPPPPPTPPMMPPSPPGREKVLRRNQPSPPQ